MRIRCGAGKATPRPPRGAAMALLVSVQPRWNAAIPSGFVTGVAGMATVIAPPMASAACRLMLITPEHHSPQ
ncbi:hypothetical protein J6500_14520 [Bradyrhizobium sp. WSM 1704]|uniref:hypothetical protein n=1 Tax=Bradyrhizobium semiaridum TaxID=2821404 RepID=UPI001CE25537|nr:hypothetical protein [Bradyrhizobium semiaridum]MCA6123099.1 hypothetical protein [Bradyrhizobium semiaridum]